MATTVENPFDTQQAKPSNTGIVGSAMTQQPTTTGQLPSNVGTSAPATPNVATYAPTTREINKPTDTVQGQVDSILAKDSPLMQRARTLATQQMAQRGLVNSSMAQGAGAAAMIDRATPIAAQDANTYNQVAQDNMNAFNQSGQFNAGEINRFGLQKNEQQFAADQADVNRQFQTAERLGGQEFASQMETGRQDFAATQSALDRTQQTNLQNNQQAYQTSLAQMDQSFRSAQASLDRAQQAFLQQDAQRFQASLTNSQVPVNFALQISNTTANAITSIAADPNLSGTVDDKDPPGSSPKSRAIQSTLNYANSQIAWANKFYNVSIPSLPTS